MDLLNEMKKKIPFIYEIGDGYYYLGCGMFCGCKDVRSIQEYLKYKEFIFSVGKERMMSECLSQEELAQIGKYLRKIQTMAETVRCLEKQPDNMLDQMETFINSLSDAHRQQLQTQLDEYICVNRMIH